MPIQMVNAGTVTGPIVVCDCCGERILRASEGNVEWSPGDDRMSALTDIVFLHKNPCSLKYERRSGKFFSSRDIDVFLVQLIGNLDLNVEEAEKREALLSLL